MKTRTYIALSDPHPHMALLISSYQDGLTTPDETEQIERHMLECERCHAFYGSLQQVRESISDLPEDFIGAAKVEAAYSAILDRTVLKNRRKGRLR